MLRHYEYVLPKERIAVEPARPRDGAKLLVYDRKTKKSAFSTFRHLPQFLPRNAVLVLNETKVVPARLSVHRTTGGRVDLLILGTVRGNIRALSHKRLHLGEVLRLTSKQTFVVQKSSGKAWVLKPSFSLVALPDILDRYGSAPLPPYIKNTPLTPKQQREEYQTVFARVPGSIAAPTASLHFTKRLLKDLEKSGVTIVKITLHVHLGTFAPLTEEQWKAGKLHPETYSMDARADRLLTQAKAKKLPIIAVGTTVARTLESAADRRGRIVKRAGTTRLFIRPGYEFKFIDGLITNFHVPQSSLLMLVSAFAGRKTILGLYQKALKRGFRFFSFGDGMLIR